MTARSGPTSDTIWSVCCVSGESVFGSASRGVSRSGKPRFALAGCFTPLIGSADVVPGVWVFLRK